MPNFFVFVRSFQVLPRRIALFATLLIAALALSVYQVPQQPEYSQVIYSQDISLITEFTITRNHGRRCDRKRTGRNGLRRLQNIINVKINHRRHSRLPTQASQRRSNQSRLNPKIRTVLNSRKAYRPPQGRSWSRDSIT